jgi:UDP-N-acetyl-2-amino-2-deoxyglucuronate dehydrogenase
MKKFALIGAAGYIAPRHIKAIKETENELVAALDKSDSVGVMDSYFPSADFFTEFERFDRHIDLLRRAGKGVDYVSITSPNYLHDSHIRFALRSEAHAICEKPLVLNPSNIDALKAIEKESGFKINNILQLRLHPSIVALKTQVQSEVLKNPGKIYDVNLTYLTSRGKWYGASWKGDEKKSGGIAANIGIHFYDMLIWVFGGVKENVVHVHRNDVASGFLDLEHARVRWFLSLNYDHIPKEIKDTGQRTYRSVAVDSVEIEFSAGFADLHTISYRHILSDCGFGLSEVRPCIEAAHDIRVAKPIGKKGEYHPFLLKVV